MQKQQGKVVAEQQIAEYISFLRENEKSENTIEKYRRDVTRFVQYCRGRPLDKNLTVEYKASLKSAYKTTSINSMLVPVNSFLSFLDREDCRVRLLKCQKKIFCDERDELKKTSTSACCAQQRRQRRNNCFCCFRQFAAREYAFQS